MYITILKWIFFLTIFQSKQYSKFSLSKVVYNFVKERWVGYWFDWQINLLILAILLPVQLSHWKIDYFDDFSACQIDDVVLTIQSVHFKAVSFRFLFSYFITRSCLSLKSRNYLVFIFIFDAEVHFIQYIF
jgi:hypothetical protein